MATVKRNQPPLVSTEAANRIQSFAHDLVTLCRQYEVHIKWRDNGLIELIDERRKCYPSGYECDATLAGCNASGVYQWDYRSRAGMHSGPSTEPHVDYSGIHIEDLQPEDWYVAESKR